MYTFETFFQPSWIQLYIYMVYLNPNLNVSTGICFIWGLYSLD